MLGVESWFYRNMVSILVWGGYVRYEIPDFLGEDRRVSEKVISGKF